MDLVPDLLPKVSILIAARNEEANIYRCLEAIKNQDYPKENFEVWVGNDMSEDKTAEMITRFCSQNSNFHLLNITENRKHLHGKTNVLAQLIDKAQSEYLLITDADGRVSETWIKEMVKNFNPDISMLTGPTVVEGDTFFARLQNAEMIFYVGNGHINAKNGRPVSAIGNNMGFRKSAYSLVGGYENIPFSVTEDYELFKNFRKAELKFKTVFNPSVLAYTRPAESIQTFLHQRRRWLTGAFQLPLQFSIGLALLWSLLPIMILIGFLFGWDWTLGLFALKWVTDLIFIAGFYKTLNQKLDTGFWLYSPYSLIFNTAIIFFYLIPAPVEWKGRKYKK